MGGRPGATRRDRLRPGRRFAVPNAGDVRRRNPQMGRDGQGAWHHGEMMRGLPGLVLVLACAMPAQAQDAATYPSKPVKIVVSTPAGGGVDTVTRMVADALQKKFGQPFIVENRGGAAGNIG